MTLPTGSPDWIKPVPGGTHKLLDVAIPAGTNQYIGPLISCIAYNGLYLKGQLTGAGGNYGQLIAFFYDSPTDLASTTNYAAVVALNSGFELNIPVLGPYVVIQILSSTVVTFSASRLLLIGHNGGPSSSVVSQGGIVAELSNVTLPASGETTLISATVVEGPGYMFFLPNGTQPGFAQLWARDAQGVDHLIARTPVEAVSNGQVTPLWLPPQPLRLDIVNTGAATSNAYYATVVKGRA